MSFYRSGKVTISSQEPMATQLDGDPSGEATKVTVKVEPAFPARARAEDRDHLAAVALRKPCVRWRRRPAVPRFRRLRSAAALAAARASDCSLIMACSSSKRRRSARSASSPSQSSALSVTGGLGVDDHALAVFVVAVYRHDRSFHRNSSIVYGSSKHTHTCTPAKELQTPVVDNVLESLFTLQNRLDPRLC